MFKIPASFLVFLAFANLPASSQPAETAVVEVFVSQNCPACPKAHENLDQLSETVPRFLQLTWSVNYWDYLGDADDMAIPESAFRQRVYAEKMALRGPYTPQVVVNGVHQTAGNQRRSVKNLLIDAVDDGAMGTVTLDFADGIVSVSGPATLAEADVLLLDVETVERNGQNLRNAVTHISELGIWAGEDFATPASCSSRCVLLVQEVGCGPIFAALEITPKAENPGHTKVLLKPQPAGAGPGEQ
ncbi:MAG: DUF1223 domain-containing protein [Pseudomonadota bacterium]